MITLKIHTKKLEKSQFNGPELVKLKHRSYIQLNVYKLDERSKFGDDYSIKQAITKERREAYEAAGEKPPYVGNGRMTKGSNHTAERIRVTIDYARIDKARLFAGTNTTEVYLDVILFDVPDKEKQTPDDPDYRVCHQLSKEERDAPGKKNYVEIGSARKVEVEAGKYGRDGQYNAGGQRTAAPAAGAPVSGYEKPANEYEVDGDDIPF